MNMVLPDLPDDIKTRSLWRGKITGQTHTAIGVGYGPKGEFEPVVVSTWAGRIFVMPYEGWKAAFEPCFGKRQVEAHGHK